MTTLAARAGVDDAERRIAVQRCLQRLRELRVEAVRVVWPDVHGVLRGKSLAPAAVAQALDDGVGLVSTLLLKDSADRTAFPVFDPAFAERWPDLAHAGNVMLLPDPASLVMLPWAPQQAWLRADLLHADGRPSPIDPRRALERATARLAERGWTLRCGLEVEFHVYRIERGAAGSIEAWRDPRRAAWPGEPPPVSLLHPGYQLLADAALDASSEALAVIRQAVDGLGLPLRSLEIELGPSQFEAVFDATDALAAADAMIKLRNGVRQALWRAGYLATFMCRPPFAQVMSSGWHLHHSLVDAAGANLMARATPGGPRGDARHALADLGAHWLAGLLHHAPALSALCVPGVDGFERFRPNAMAPQAIVWGHDNRGAMLRVVGAAGDAATRIENRIATPAANPYLALAGLIAAGLDGVARRLEPPPATPAPYAVDDVALLPRSLALALDELPRDRAIVDALGAPLVEAYLGIKRNECRRHAEAEDPVEWQRREYLGRL